MRPNPPPDTNQIPTVCAKIDYGVHRFVFWVIAQSRVRTRRRASRTSRPPMIRGGPRGHRRGDSAVDNVRQKLGDAGPHVRQAAAESEVATEQPGEADGRLLVPGCADAAGDTAPTDDADGLIEACRCPDRFQRPEKARRR